MRTNRGPCPICDVMMTGWLDADLRGTNEELNDCPTGHYRYEFTYGMSVESVGGRDWHWTHHETEEHRVAREAEIDAAIERTKEKVKVPPCTT